MKVKARIIKGIGGFYYCKPADSSFLLSEENGLIECKPRGVFRYRKVKPQVGDYVYLNKGKDGWTIDEIVDRKNSLIRPSVSNVDLALICISVKSPEPNLNLLDILLINCYFNNIEPVLCLTKVDLDYEKALEIKSVYEKLGIPVVLLSNTEGDELDKLIELTKSRTAFLAGNSGVGKSSLSNRICSSQMAVGELSEKLDRGKHTTRHIELLETYAGGYILDTPGFSNLELDEALFSEMLKDYYPEFKNLACFYNNCNHISEPKCGVKEQVKEGIIDKGRYLRYRTLFNSIKNKKNY